MKTLDTTTDTAKVTPMKRRGVTGKLCTVGYLTVRLGCSRQTALMISQHWSFPVPVDVLNPDSERPMAVWWRKDVDKWLKENPDPVRRKR